MNGEEIAVAVVVIGGMIVIYMLIRARQKKSSWIGDVIDRQHEDSSSDEDGFTPEKFIVIFRTTTGKNVRVDLNEKDYNKYQIGDRAEKKAGEYYPTKL